MKEVTAKLKYLRISPRKVRLVADLIKGVSLKEAKLQASLCSKKAGHPLSKILKSIESNAKNNFKMEPENLYIKKISVDSGPVLKRWMPRARGRATMIRRRTSHISVVLKEKAKKEKAS